MIASPFLPFAQKYTEKSSIMCFRNSLTATVAEMENRFGAVFESNVPEIQPIYHANGFEFPTWPIVTAQAPQTFKSAHWGLIPRWAKSMQEAQELRQGTLNAKIETLEEKPSFKYALQNAQRCLIPSTGFFEWQTVGKQKYPYFIHLRSQSLFAMAGLWESWQNPHQPSDIWHTFSVITTEANPLMAKIHNTKQRMPVILLPGTESIWLQTNVNSSLLEQIGEPLDEKLMEAYTISKMISNPKANSNVPTIIQPMIYPELSQQQLRLF
ncbi:MAG: SOS response-associated peptidase [Spirosomataceae bacterium]